ncbi:MAG: DUF58 domain-containing protein [Elusimicrobia bacterium]|nr:DUF58 domain-containing protein [Elusimicrobiota bacterium]
MTLRARYVAEGFISGLHQSPYKGSSIEFAQHRQYVPGDELRYMDWKVYARSDRYYIREFEEETNLRGYNIIDTSSSMGYTSGSVTKLEYASYLSAAITYLMMKQRDSAGLITFSGGVNEFIPPRNYSLHLKFIMDRLERLSPAGKSNFESSFNEIGKRIKKRNLLVIYSDLLEDPGVLERSLKFFPYLKNDVIVFHILDPEEMKLSLSGEIEYVDLESGSSIFTRPEVIRNEYRKNFDEYLSRTEMGLRSHKIDYCRITTDMKLDHALSLFMEGRGRILL